MKTFISTFVLSFVIAVMVISSCGNGSVKSCNQNTSDTRRESYDEYLRRHNVELSTEFNNYRVYRVKFYDVKDLVIVENVKTGDFRIAQQ